MINVGLRLYRSGHWPDAIVDDNQLWAEADRVIGTDGAIDVTLEPRYGSAASYYRVFFQFVESPETNWIAARVNLIIDNMNMGILPLSWYNGSPTDWPSGLARFPEAYGPRSPQSRYEDSPEYRGVWTLAARRFR